MGAELIGESAMDDRTAVLGALSEEIYVRMRGLETEERFFSALFDGPMPGWFLGVRRPTLHEDEVDRVDAFVRTDLGEVPFQIKNSYYRAQVGMSLYFERGISIIVIPHTVSDRIIRQDAVLKVEEWRRNKLKSMRSWRSQWTPWLVHVSRLTLSYHK